MPDIILLAELADFYDVSIPEIIDGERKSENMNEEVKETLQKAIEKYKELGAEVEEFSLDIAQYSLATYYIIACAEASSNLGRFDGIRYGYRTPEYSNLKELYKKSRSEGFGEEVKRRKAKRKGQGERDEKTTNRNIGSGVMGIFVYTGGICERQCRDEDIEKE